MLESLIGRLSLSKGKLKRRGIRSEPGIPTVEMNFYRRGRRRIPPSTPVGWDVDPPRYAVFIPPPKSTMLRRGSLSSSFEILFDFRERFADVPSHLSLEAAVLVGAFAFEIVCTAAMAASNDGSRRIPSEPRTKAKTKKPEKDPEATTSSESKEKVKVAVRRTGETVDKGMKLVLLRKTTLRTAYRKVEKKADPPLRNPVNGLYTESGKPIEKTSDLVEGQELLYTCTGDEKPATVANKKKGSTQDLLSIRLSKPKQKGPKTIHVYRWISPLHRELFKRTNYKPDAHLVIKLLNSIDSMESLKSAVVKKGKMDSSVPLGDLHVVGFFSFEGKEKLALNDFEDGESVWAQTLTDTKPTPALAKKACSELRMTVKSASKTKKLTAPIKEDPTAKGTRKKTSARSSPSSIDWEEQSHIFVPGSNIDPLAAPHLGIKQTDIRKANTVSSREALAATRKGTPARRSIVFPAEEAKSLRSPPVGGDESLSPARKQSTAESLASTPSGTPAAKAAKSSTGSPMKSRWTPTKMSMTDAPEPANMQDARISPAIDSVALDKGQAEGNIASPGPQKGQKSPKKTSRPKWYHYIRF